MKPRSRLGVNRMLFRFHYGKIEDGIMRYRYMTVLPALVLMSLPLDGHADYLRRSE